jgi:hypothetical protein
MIIYINKLNINKLNIKLIFFCKYLVCVFIINTLNNQQPNTTNNNKLSYSSIYLIQTREFLTQNINVFKIGKTKDDISTRLSNYGKGGRVIFTLICDDDKIDNIEKELFNIGASIIPL